MKNYMKILQFITISHKSLIHPKPLRLDSIKQMDLLELMMELDIQYHLEVKNMIPSATRLDIL